MSTLCTFMLTASQQRRGSNRSAFIPQSAAKLRIAADCAVNADATGAPALLTTGARHKILAASQSANEAEQSEAARTTQQSTHRNRTLVPDEFGRKTVQRENACFG